MLTLFGNLDSGNVHKAQLILARSGVEYRRVDVSQTRNEPRRAEFLAINPMGKVPALLRDDGRLITESGAILYHFAPGASLWPDGADARTEVLWWMFFEQYSHEPSLAVMRYLRQFTVDPDRHAERVAELHPRAMHALARPRRGATRFHSLRRRGRGGGRTLCRILSGLKGGRS